MDKFHLFLKDSKTSKYTVEVCKRFRKWGGIPTAILRKLLHQLQHLMVLTLRYL